MAAVAADRMLLDSDSEGDIGDNDGDPKWGGSKLGKDPNKTRDFAGAHGWLIAAYFGGEDSTYDKADFQQIFQEVQGNGFFNQCKDALGKVGITPLVCICAVLKILARRCNQRRVNQDRAFVRSAFPFPLSIYDLQYGIRELDIDGDNQQ